MTKKIDMERSFVFVDWKDVKSLDIIGYFFNSPDSWVFDTLVASRSNSEYAFQTLTGRWFKHFVPANLIEFKEEKEPEYVPFTKMEQLNNNNMYVGGSIFVKHKEQEYTYLAMLTVVTLDSKGHIAKIGLGLNTFSPEELFDNYLWCRSRVDNEWRPFGVQNDKT